MGDDPTMRMVEAWYASLPWWKKTAVWRRYVKTSNAFWRWWLSPSGNGEGET